MRTRDLFPVLSIAAMAAFVVSFAVASQNPAQSQETEHTVTRDSVTVLLDHKGIASGSFIHLYDATPYHIMNGHVAAKLPCDNNSESPLAIVVGQAPDVKPVEMEVLSELSKPGDMCIYHVDLPPEGMEHKVTDIALLNPGNEAVRLPRTSTVVIGVNEIMPLAGEHMEHGG